MFTRQHEDGVSQLTRRAERQLIEQARQGDEDAARALVDSHKDRLFAFAWRILRNHHETEEICQDAFLRAFSSLDSFSSEYRFSTWLFTIAYRLCLNQLRRRRKQAGELDTSTLASDASDVSEQVAESEQARQLKATIWGAVDELSVPQRAAVLLFYREGLSCEAIAQALEIPVATAKSHLHRARGRLRDALADKVGDVSEIPWLREAAS